MHIALMINVSSSKLDSQRHHSAQLVSVYSPTAIPGPMTVCIAPERTKRLYGPLNVADVRRSTGRLNDRPAIVSAREKHEEIYYIVPEQERGNPKQLTKNSAAAEKSRDTFHYLVTF